MPQRKDFLGSGKYGVVYGTAKYAIKQVDDKDAFNAEVDVYRCLSKVDSLRGRVPEFHGIERDKQLLYLQRVYEKPLRNQLPDESALLQIRQHLLETINIIHKCGWCHGDINLDNIFASGLLFDFSHAHTKSKLCAQKWADFQKKDRRDIESCYHQVLGLKKLEAAMALLDSDVDDHSRQAELAEILHHSETSSELLKKLRKITDPIPFLALEICRAFRRERRVGSGMRLLQELKPRVPRDDQSRRLHVQIQGELALCESYSTDTKACTMFKDAVQTSIALLGRADKDTIRIRMAYATLLGSSCRYSDALDVLTALKVDCKNSLDPCTERIEQMEARLRVKRAKKRRRERLMPTEQTPVKDDKKNIARENMHCPSKKRKLTQESGRESEESRLDETNFDRLIDAPDLVPEQ